MASIRLVDVDKVFPNSHTAVRGLNLEIDRGELVVLAAPSGSGKTTILRMIAGLEAPTRGRVYLGDKDVTAMPAHTRDLAMVFQAPALYPHKTVRGNLSFGLRSKGLANREIRDRISGTAGTLGIDSLLDRKPSQLSGGERQRVALGRALVRRPNAYLFDEPLSNLDAQLRLEMRGELLRLHMHLGITMLYVTHDQAEAMTLGDRLAVMDRGMVQQFAAPIEVYCRPVNRFVAGFIGAPPMNFISCLVEKCDGTVRIKSPWFALELKNYAGIIPKSAQAALGIRPHDIRLTELHEGDTAGLIEAVQPLGSETLVHLTLPSNSEKTSMQALVSPLFRAKPQDRVGIHFAREQIHLFDGQDGRRLNGG